MPRSARAPTSRSCSASSSTASTTTRCSGNTPRRSPNAPYIVKEGFGYSDGLFTGYDEARRDYNRTTWEYELGDDGYVKSDIDHPRSVWNLLKKHIAIYTPEMVERICGTPKDKFLKVAQMIGESRRRPRR